MNVFLTGISGFSGFHIANYLVKKNYNVHALIRKKNSVKENEILKNGKINYIYNSLEDLDFLPEKTNVIIHTAAVSPTKETCTGDFIRDNVLGTQNLVSLARMQGVEKFIFFSTISVYGEINDVVLKENTPIVNPNAYGMSKLLGELCLREASDKIMSLAIRFPAIIGRGTKRHWLANTLEKALLNQDICIFNPDAYFNNAIHIRELCFFIEKLLLKSWNEFDIINISSSGGMKIKNILNMIIEKTGSLSRVIESPSQNGHFSINTKRAEEVYGYKPISFETALESYLFDSIVESKNEILFKEMLKHPVASHA